MFVEKAIEKRVRKTLLGMLRPLLERAFEQHGYDYFYRLTKIDPTVLRTLLEEDREKDLSLEQVIALAEAVGQGVEFTFINSKRKSHEIRITLTPWETSKAPS